jgi:hypothetical protein
MDLYQIQGINGQACEPEPNGLLTVSKHRSRKGRVTAQASQPLFRIKQGLLDLED